MICSLSCTHAQLTVINSGIYLFPQGTSQEDHSSFTCGEWLIFFVRTTVQSWESCVHHKVNLNKYVFLVAVEYLNYLLRNWSEIMLPVISRHFQTTLEFAGFFNFWTFCTKQNFYRQMKSRLTISVQSFYRYLKFYSNRRTK